MPLPRVFYFYYLSIYPCPFLLVKKKQIYMGIVRGSRSVPILNHHHHLMPSFFPIDAEIGFQPNTLRNLSYRITYFKPWHFGYYLPSAFSWSFNLFRHHVRRGMAMMNPLHCHQIFIVTCFRSLKTFTGRQLFLPIEQKVCAGNYVRF